MTPHLLSASSSERLIRSEAGRRSKLAKSSFVYLQIIPASTRPFCQSDVKLRTLPSSAYGSKHAVTHCNSAPLPRSFFLREPFFSSPGVGTAPCFDLLEDPLDIVKSEKCWKMSHMRPRVILRSPSTSCSLCITLVSTSARCSIRMPTSVLSIL